MQSVASVVYASLITMLAMAPVLIVVEAIKELVDGYVARTLLFGFMGIVFLLVARSIGVL